MASPTLAETDPVPYEEFLAENDISFTASEVLDEYRIVGCEESNDVRGYIPHTDFDPVQRHDVWASPHGILRLRRL